jgi:hypothetical protein
MTLRRRLERIEGKRGRTPEGPSVIFICVAETGEPENAILVGGGGLTREPGESADAFRARAHAAIRKP